MSAPPGAVVRITWWRKFVLGLATGAAWLTGWCGFYLGMGIPFIVEPTERDDGLLILALGGIGLLVMFGSAQLLVLLALGPQRTRGSVGRFARWQLAAFGIGIAGGLCFWALVVCESMPVRVATLIGALILFVPSAWLFVPDARRPLDVPPAPTRVRVPAVVEKSWRGVDRLAVPSLHVVQFHDEWGQKHRLWHLQQQKGTNLRALGMVEFEQHQAPRGARFLLEPTAGAASRYRAPADPDVDVGPGIYVVSGENRDGNWQR